MHVPHVLGHRVFRHRAIRRAVVRHRAHGGIGHRPEVLVVLTLDELGRLAVDDAGAKLVGRYLERRAVAGPVRGDALAFISAEGARLKAEELSTYVSRLRRVGINAEFNSALCKGLLSVRFDLETPFVPKTHNKPDTIEGRRGA